MFGKGTVTKMKYCSNCGAQLEDYARVCSNCGAQADDSSVPSAPTYQPPEYNQTSYGQTSYGQPPVVINNIGMTPDQLPPQYRPLSPWAYFGLNILFSVPVVGLVFLIVFAFNKSNINRRNFARSFFCLLLIVVVIGLIVLAITAATGGTIALFDNRH